MALVVTQRGVASPEFRAHANGVNRVILFLNDNISGALIAQRLVPEMIDMGVEPVIVILHPSVPDKAKIKDLRDFGFYDSMIVNHLGNLVGNVKEDAHVPPVSAHMLQLARNYSLSLFSIENGNTSLEITELLDSKTVMGAISIRNLEIFKQPLITSFAEHNAFLWNLHSGDLPEYRGVHPLLRAMADGKTTSGWTLHEIDAGIDTGPIIDHFEGKVDLNNAYMTEFYAKIPEATQLIVNALGNQKTKGKVKTYANPHASEGQYYTFPTKAELDGFKEQGLRFVDPQDMVKFYMQLYTDQSVERQQLIEAALTSTILVYNAGREDTATITMPRTATGIQLPTLKPGSGIGKKGNGSAVAAA